MNKMKIGILSFITAISTTFGGEVEQSTPYLNIEGGYPSIVNLNLGYRSQKDHNGLDGGLGVCPIIFYNLNVYGYANYLYFLNPDPYSQHYVGVGSQVGYGGVGQHIFETYTWFARPQLLVGKEFRVNGREKHFIQLTAGNYFKFSESNRFNPSLTLSYGFIY